MSTNWDRLIENHFAKKKERNSLTLDLLLESISEAMGEMQDLPANHVGYTLAEGREIRRDPTDEEGKTGDVEVIRRPIIKISELWGTPGEHDREIMEEMMGGIVGGTLEEKIKGVNDFLTDPVPAEGEGDISKIMSYLIFLDTFASIIADYGASVTGFLFEAFLAALFGGTSIQVDDPEQVGAKGSLPIEDNQLFMQLKQCRDDEEGEGCEEWGVVPYSLKVLRQGGPVHGSYKNLVDFFLDPAPERKSDSITYLIVIKEAPKLKGGKLGEWTGKLVFYEFSITRKNFLELIGAPNQVPIFGYRPYTTPIEGGYITDRRQEVGMAVLDGETKPKKRAQIKEKPLYLLADDTPWPEGEPIPRGTALQRQEQVGVKEVASAKLFSPEEYERIKGEFTEVEISRQTFAALKDTKGYGSKAKGGAQWTIPAGVYTKFWKGEINLDPALLKTKAEEYTQSLNAGIVAIFNSLGALSDNINSYFIAGKKSSGLEAVQNAATLKDEVNKIIPTKAIEKPRRDVQPGATGRQVPGGRNRMQEQKETT